MPLSTAKLYTRLAHYRDVIEVERGRFPDLSLRAACRLIKGAGNDSRKNKAKKPPSELIAAWAAASGEERTQHLDRVTVRGILDVASLDFRRELQSRLRKQQTEDAPEYKLTMALRSALGFIKGADDPQAGPATAQARENMALSALRGLVRMHPDLTELSVGFGAVEDPKQARKERKQRRAA